MFVERKTHRESWKGEESVKERIVLPEENVVPFLEQTYTVEQAVDDLRAKVGMKRALHAGLIAQMLASTLSAAFKYGSPVVPVRA